MNFQIYVILDRRYLNKNPKILVKEVIKGGCSALQYRDKISSTKDFYHLAKELHQIAKEKNVPFIINNRIDIALSLGAEGVHLGIEDLPIKPARQVLGLNKIIGKSVHNLKEARQAKEEGVNYVGVGPVFPSQTKENLPALISRAELKEIKEKLDIPVVAIGGIKAENIKELLEIGIENFAISADILTAESPAKQVKIIKEIIEFKNYR